MITPTEKDRERAADLCRKVVIRVRGVCSTCASIAQALAEAREEGRKEVRDEWENSEIRRNRDGKA